MNEIMQMKSTIFIVRGAYADPMEDVTSEIIVVKIILESISEVYKHRKYTRLQHKKRFQRRYKERI